MNRDEALAKFDRLKRPQRKMVDIAVDEVSAVDSPAHGVPGWVVMKSADVPPPETPGAYVQTFTAEQAADLMEGSGLTPEQQADLLEGLE